MKPNKKLSGNSRTTLPQEIQVMNTELFLDSIYKSIKVGGMIQKPTKQSEILEIHKNGNIYYRIGTTNKKAVTKSELVKTFEILQKRELLTTDIAKIATSSKPCNVTSIKWLLTNSGLVKESSNGSYTKKW